MSNNKVDNSNDQVIFTLLFTRTYLMKNERSVLLLITQIIFSGGEQSLADCDREDLTRLARGVREQNIQLSNGGSSVIFITSNISHIPVSIYQKNPDSKLITLGNPDREERKAIVENISAHFKLKIDLDSDEQSRIDLIDGMDNFTAKEIIQVAQLSKSTEDITVEKLLSLYKYGKKESPWEQLEPKKVRQISEILSKTCKRSGFSYC
jgi:hypothetical protein